MNRTLFRWHRRIGITSALFVLVLAISGLLLLFANGLGLDSKTIRGNLVSTAYNLAPKNPPLGVEMDGGLWIINVDGLVYVGEGAPISVNSPLLRVGKQEGFLELITKEELILAQIDGQIVERQSIDEAMSIEGKNLGPLPDDITAKALNRFRGEGLPASRVILDIHTGRIFGRLGPWVMGLASLLLILLSLSGIVMWSSAGQRRRRRERLERRAANRADQTE